MLAGGLCDLHQFLSVILAFGAFQMGEETAYFHRKEAVVAWDFTSSNAGTDGEPFFCHQMFKRGLRVFLVLTLGGVSDAIPLRFYFRPTGAVIVLGALVGKAGLGAVNRLLFLRPVLRPPLRR